MISTRIWIASLLAGCGLGGFTLAQEEAASSSGAATSGSSNSGASSSFGSSTTEPAPSSPFGPPPSATETTAPGTTTTPSGTSTTPSGTGIESTDTDAASTFGLSPRKIEETPAVFSVSPGYGQAAQVFVAGSGRLARPRFETKVSTSIGFDDNIFQTPTKGDDIPEQRIEVLVEPEVPAQVVRVPRQQAARPTRIGAIRPAPQAQQFDTVIIPRREAVYDEIVIPGVKAPKRKASLISRASLTFEAQFATRRDLFTFDLNANGDYYWNRPNDKTDYNGSLSLIYLRRLTPRLQFSTSLSASYQTQPDLAQINTPTRTGAGEYLNFTSKTDLAYRWTPRFSTVSSLSYNRLAFIETAAQGGDYGQTTLGTELRYLWSPRLTGVVEGRYTFIRYDDNPAVDSTTYFALLGMDITATRRAAGTIRVGAAMREFEEGGDKSIAPYLETTLNYQLARSSVVSWNGRFGFEEPPGPTSEVLSLRSGLSVNHFFSPRLRGALSINAVQRVTSTEGADDVAELSFDTTLSLEYTLTRRWTFNGYYTFTDVFVDPGKSDYFRNRLFLGLEYEF